MQIFLSRIGFWSLGWEKVNVVAVILACGIESRLTAHAIDHLSVSPFDSLLLPHLQVDDIVRAAKRACYRAAVPMAATA
jgi:hypothetical protein